MKKTFIKQISLFLMITCCGFSFTNGIEYFLNNWNGRFYFMVGNF